MKMKKWMLLIVFLITLKGVGQQIIGKFNVNGAQFGDRVISESSVGNDWYVVLHTHRETGRLCMTTFKAKDGTLSSGYVHDYYVRDDTTVTGENKRVLTFMWDYKNNYNSDTGTARIMFTMIDKPKMTVFVMNMLLPNKEVDFFSGVKVLGVWE